MADTYIDSTGETRDKSTGKLIEGTGAPDAPIPQSTVPPGQSSDGAGATALKPQSPLATPDELEIGKHEAGIATAQKPYLDKIKTVLDSPPAAHAQLEKVKDAPNPQDYHKYSMEFASAMAVMGAIAGKFTRAGGTAALSAYGAALKGWQAGNVQAYEEASKQWEQNTKKTIENNNVELQKYQEILNDKKANIEQMMAGLTIASSEYQNKVIFDMAKDGNFNAVAQAVDKMGQANQRLQGAFGQLTDVRKDQTAQVKSQIDTYNNDPALNQRIKQQDPVKWAQLRATGETLGIKLNDPPAGTEALPKVATNPRSAPAMALQKFIAENPGATSEQISEFAAHYSGEQKATRDFGSGTQGNAIRSFSVALDHLDVAEQLGRALQNGDSQALNMLRNTVKQQFGGEGAVDFNFAKKIVGDEITKSILGSGAGTGQDREDIQKAFSAANSPQQLEGVIKTAKRLMAGQLHGLKQQYEQTTHQTDFDSRLSPAAQRELGGLAPATGADSGNDGWGQVKVH